MTENTNNIFSESENSRSKILMPSQDFPPARETQDANFDTFVAFDIITTGLNPHFESIIEIAAVKVVDGIIPESSDSVFSEIVKPLNNKPVNDRILHISGITENDIMYARDIREVFTDFMSFVGDNVLVAYNCMSFCCAFLVRAGRYSNYPVMNLYFDVSHYAKRFYKKLGITGNRVKLSEVAAKLNIETPRKNKALADAVTTAKVYLELNRTDTGRNMSFEDLLTVFDSK